MSLDNLEQALFTAKWGDAEEDAIAVIAKALELPNGIVERVLFAADVAKARRNTRKFTQLTENMFEGPTLPLELRKAIGHAVEAGMKRAAVRHVIQNDYRLYVRPAKLVRDNVRNICDGCPISIECMLTDASKPEVCVKKGVLHSIRRRGEENRQQPARRLRGDAYQDGR
jgi:hypothetical protein